MTGTVTVVETSNNALSRVSFTWTATAGGAASGTSRFKHTGNIVAVCTVPSTETAPTQDYDITLTDEASVDVGNGQLVNRHATNTEWVFASLGSVVRDKITMTIANAGNAGKGVCHVFIGKGDQAATSDDIRAALYGAAGIAAFPNAAAPANDVSIAEVLRSVWAGLMGTAAGENGITTWPAAAAPGNAVSLAEGLRYIVESQLGALTNTGGTTTLTAILGDVANSSIATRLSALSTSFAAVPRTVEKTDGSVPNGADALFTVAGGPVLCQIYGMVTTALDGAATCRLSILPTDPAVKVELNAGAVAINTAVAGSMIYNVGATSVLTLNQLGAVLLDPVTVEPTWFLLTPGVVSATFSAARAGVIRWFCVYKPLSPLSSVTMAA